VPDKGQGDPRGRAGPQGVRHENAPAFLESTPAFAALLSMIEGREALDDEKFAALEDTVTRRSGAPLAVAATRATAVGSPSPAAWSARPSPPRRREPRPKLAAPPAAPPRPEPVMVGTGTPVAPPRSEPVIVGTGTPVAPLPKTPARRERARARWCFGSRPGRGEQAAAQDEAAQWWVSAWARWTSWRGTLSFVDAVKEELASTTTFLSVPIQKSTDYEDGSSRMLLDFARLHRASRAKARQTKRSTASRVPARGQRRPWARTSTTSVSRAACATVSRFREGGPARGGPEPASGPRAHLESTTETRIFTHPSNRIGDPEHNSQRLTQERSASRIIAPDRVAPSHDAILRDRGRSREPRSIDVKLQDAAPSQTTAWLMTMPPSAAPTSSQSCSGWYRTGRLCRGSG